MSLLKRQFAIGDVHGHYCALAALLNALDLQAGDQVTLLGDLIDHGPDSLKVLDLVMSLVSRDDVDVRCVQGNHEAMLLAAVDDADVELHWLRYGGDKTLNSFGVSCAAQLPSHYLNFLRNLPLWYEDQGYVFVHAGAEPERAMADQSESTLQWQHLDSPVTLHSGKTLVHGHTPRLHPQILPHYLSLDTGIATGGCLTAIELTSRVVWQVDGTGDLIVPGLPTAA